MTGILNGLIVCRNAGLRPEIHRGVRSAGVWSEPPVGNLQLQSERSECEPIVGVEVERDPSVSDKTRIEVLVPVLHPATVRTDAEPAFGVDLEQTRDVEPVSGRNVVGELSLRLGDGEITTHRETRREWTGVVDDLCVGDGCRRENASSAE